MKEKQLIRIYGEDSWAIVTGATDGIGWEFCQQLAKRGFNIGLISRTEAKINMRIEQLQSQYPSRKYQSIIADFTNGDTLDFYNKIENQIKDIDVSILVNNVGFRIGTLEANTPQLARDSCIINTAPQVMLTKKLIPKFLERKISPQRDSKRGAIVNLSSLNCILPLRGRALYSSTKRFNQYLSTALGYEHSKHSIDFLALKPGFVSTPLNQNRKTDFVTCTTAECVEGCLQALGHTDEAYGAKKHIVLAFVCNSLLWVIPEWFRVKVTEFIAYKVLGTNRALVTAEDPKK